MLLQKSMLNIDGFFYFMTKPKFCNQPKKFSYQLALLKSRGMILDADAESCLSHANYYRLGEFWKYYYEGSSKIFNEGTAFSKIWDEYRNDRRLRFLILDAVERIEVSFKTKLANTISLEDGNPFAHTDKKYLKDPTDIKNAYSLFLQKAHDETTRSTEDFVEAFFDEFDEKELPIWMLVEILSFGTVSRYYEMLSDNLRKKIACEYNLDQYVFRKWLQFLSIVRNMCCHHARFWKRDFGWKPPVLKQNVYRNWNPSMDFTKVYGLLCILKYFMNIIRPDSRWHSDLDNFLSSIGDLTPLGFPNEWKIFVPWR